MNRPKVFVAGSGMITSIGKNTPMTAASIKAQVNKYQETDYINKNLKRMKAAFVSDDALPDLKGPILDIPGLSSRYKRMLQMAEPALVECIKNYPLAEPLPLFLACPEALPDSQGDINTQILKHLKIQTDMDLELNNSRVFMTGRAGGIQALDMACRYFDATGKDFALVGGIDACRYALHLLGSLDRDDRISAPGVFDAYTPGEAAAFVLLVSEKAVDKYGLSDSMKVYMPGLASEAGHMFSSDDYKGDGLSDAFKQAISNGPDLLVDAIYSSTNGESYWNKEYGVAVARNSLSLKKDYAFEHPCDCFGDIGAAFAPVMLGVLGESLKGNALCYCSSDSEYRSVVYVSA